MGTATNDSFSCVDAVSSSALGSVPQVEVILSRPAYRLGGSVVGTILLKPPAASPTTTTGDETKSPRSWFQSAHVFVAGRCRIDPRWHNVETYERIYGVHPNLEGKYEGEWDGVDARAVEAQVGSADGTTVCFWATNVMDLMQLRERTVGAWKDVNPRAAAKQFLPSLQKQGEDMDLVHPSADDNLEVADDLESRHVAFTFRAELPADLPHSASTTCCRYFYSVVTCVRTYNNKEVIVNKPFTVWSPIEGALPQTDETLSLATRIRLGTLSAMAHSSGLPCHVSATELHRPRGQMTVNRHACLRSVLGRGDVKTMRVADPKGQPCCILTVMGSTLLNPGGRLLMQLDLAEGSVPCCQVSACLQGEEIAVYEDGSHHRTRAYVFDTAHEMIEPGCTDRVSLSLLLPLNCPCTMHTDIVKISVSCRMDLTVEEPDGSYNNLRLDLPCRVAHSVASEEVDQRENGLSKVPPLDELIFGDDADSLMDEDYRSPSSFRTKDIMTDLKALSLHILDSYNIQK